MVRWRRKREKAFLIREESVRIVRFPPPLSPHYSFSMLVLLFAAAVQIRCVVSGTEKNAFNFAPTTYSVNFTNLFTEMSIPETE